MTNMELCRAIGKVDNKFLEEAEGARAEEAEKPEKEEKMKKGSFRSKTRKWKPAIIAAACFGLLATVVFAWNIRRNPGSGRDIKLERSDKKIQVYTLDEAPAVSSSYGLAFFTEEEIFTKWDTAIFRGTVLSVQNIAIKHGQWEEYRAIATIRVEEVFRGGCKTGDTVSLLLPCPVNMEGYWVENSEVASSVRVGMSGIFMPLKYDENSTCIYYEGKERAEVKLYLLDLAEYGLPDGERFMFLDTEKGLLYAKFAYESLEGASTLEDIEAYIRKMLQESK